MKFEFEIVINHYGNLAVFKRYDNRKLRFWAYARTIEAAVVFCAGYPTTIITKA